ncbi:peptide ABC transporter substrate-binding protein [Secundilactobacillus odoratitofui]|uniref:peptide ABC transporter substrate-binding protein n=1 Tax=Secundilactobacillus odoratitofui TaxID=480930 RepID=UPI0030844B00
MSIAGVSASMILLAACGNSKTSSSKQQITLMQQADLTSLDTSNAAEMTQWTVLTNSMEGIYRSNSKNEPAPGIATKVVKPTNGGKTYTFHLRKNAKWSNGSSVTAKDFENAWKRSVSPKAKSGYNYIFSGIKNADQITAGKKSYKTLGVKAVNKYTLRVDLEHPMPYFNKMMTMAAFLPQSQDAIKKFGNTYGTSSAKMYYDGPFTVKGWTGSEESWKLSKNSRYYDKKAIKLSTINMKVVKDPNTAHNMFSEGKLDDAVLTGVTAMGVQKNKNLKHVQKANSAYLMLNTASGQPLNNVKMRQALSLAVNRERLVKKIVADGSTPSSTMVSTNLTTDPTTGKDFGTETSQKESFNVTKAKKLWKQGMQESGLKGPVKITIVGPDTTNYKELAQFLQGEYQQELGTNNIKVNASNLPSKAAVEKQSAGDFDGYQTGWVADFGDPISYLTIMEKGNPQNYGKYNDAKFNQYAKNLTSTKASSTSYYWKNLRAAEKRLNETAPIVPLYNNVESHLVNHKLKGVLYHSVGEYDYTRAYLK